MKLLASSRQPISYSAIEAEVQAIAKKIENLAVPELIYLFGSAAEDRFTDQSDIDILVVCREQSLRTAQKSVGTNLPLSKKFFVEIVWITCEVWSAKKNLGGVCHTAFNEGKLLFAKKDACD